MQGLEPVFRNPMDHSDFGYGRILNANWAEIQSFLQKLKKFGTDFARVQKA
jgi:hypothetical protein